MKGNSHTRTITLPCNICEGRVQIMEMSHQQLPDLDNALWFGSFAKNALVRCFLMTMTCSIDASLINIDVTNKWRAEFFYVPFTHTSTSNERNNHNTSSYEPEFHVLNTALRKYRETSQGILRQLSLSHEIALRTEQLLITHHNTGPIPKTDEVTSSKLLSIQIEEKISKVAELAEQNSFVLESLLKPFSVSTGLSKFTEIKSGTLVRATHESISTLNTSQDSSLESSEVLTRLGRYIPPYKLDNAKNEFGSEEQSYEDASQIIAHITRDWTGAGASIRELTYDWIVEQLWNYHRQLTSAASETCLSDLSRLSPVLVPGAGMGRLAYDIAFFHDGMATTDDSCNNATFYYPFEVEAADSSIVMASAAFHILNNYTELGDRIFPFVFDPFTNEVDTKKRWDTMFFPQQGVLDSLNRLDKVQRSPTLYYTIGDFVSIYASRAKHQMYGAITTCYFIDTATNIYEYIITIKNLLRHDGGVWINVGPVQWHRTAQLQPSVNELRQIIELFGFQIHHWEVENKVVGYRHSDDVISSDYDSRFTRSEGYRPLKFVASLADCERMNEAEDLYPVLERLHLSTGRKSLLYPIWEDKSDHTERDSY